MSHMCNHYKTKIILRALPRALYWLRVDTVGESEKAISYRIYYI